MYLRRRSLHAEFEKRTTLSFDGTFGNVQSKDFPNHGGRVPNTYETRVYKSDSTVSRFSLRLVGDTDLIVYKRFVFAAPLCAYNLHRGGDGRMPLCNNFASVDFPVVVYN